MVIYRKPTRGLKAGIKCCWMKLTLWLVFHISSSIPFSLSPPCTPFHTPLRLPLPLPTPCTPLHHLLLEMCKSLDLRILNGRCKGDSLGPKLPSTEIKALVRLIILLSAMKFCTFSKLWQFVSYHIFRIIAN